MCGGGTAKFTSQTAACSTRYYDELVEKILQHFPLAGEGFTPEECYSAAVAMAVSLPAREIDEKCEALYNNENK